MTEKKISINICGDFYSDTSSPDENYFPGEILELFHKPDLNIVNLECPVVDDRNKKILKSGPHLSGSPHTFSYLRQTKYQPCDTCNKSSDGLWTGGTVTYHLSFVRKIQ